MKPRLKALRALYVSYNCALGLSLPYLLQGPAPTPHELVLFFVFLLGRLWCQADGVFSQGFRLAAPDEERPQAGRPDQPTQQRFGRLGRALPCAP